MLAAAGTGTARMASVSFDRSTVDVDVTGGNAVLVVPQQYYPGWTASVDGVSTPIKAAQRDDAGGAGTGRPAHGHVHVQPVRPGGTA